MHAKTPSQAPEVLNAAMLAIPISECCDGGVATSVIGTCLPLVGLGTEEGSGTSSSPPPTRVQPGYSQRKIAKSRPSPYIKWPIDGLNFPKASP